MVVSVSSSMLKILKGFLLGKKDGDISPSEAEKIQKASYALNNADVKKRFSPTYLSILSGLDSEEKQVFEAAVYYLTRIAIKKPKQQEAILKYMEDKALTKGLNPEFKEYLKQHMLEISQKNNH